MKWHQTTHRLHRALRCFEFGAEHFRIGVDRRGRSLWVAVGDDDGTGDSTHRTLYGAKMAAERRWRGR